MTACGGAPGTLADKVGKLTLREVGGQKKAREATNTRRYNLLSELSAVCHYTEQLRSEILIVLLAARDTTAGLLSSIFSFIARHAEVWDALAGEVD